MPNSSPPLPDGQRMIRWNANLQYRTYSSWIFPFSVIITLILFHGINNYIWLKNSLSVPLVGDEAFHIRKLFEQYYPLENLMEWVRILKDGTYSPLYYLTSVSFNRLLGEGLFATRMANIFWFIIILVSTYKLGKYLFSRETGLLSAIILSFYPVVYGSSRLFREEFGLMGMVPLAMLFLFKTQGFKNLKYSLLFGVIFGIGMMVKIPFILFMISPVIYILVKSLISDKEKKGKLRNFFITFVIVVLIIFPRFLDPFQAREYVLTPFGEALGQGGWYEFFNLKVFTLGMINYQLTLPFFLLFFIALFLFIKKERKDIKIVFLLWIFVPLVFLTFIPHRKLIRHIIPYLPAIALISSFGITSIKKGTVKRVMIFLIIFIGLVQYYEFSFGMGVPLDKLKLNIFKKNIPYFYSTLSNDNNVSCCKPFKGRIYREVVSYIDKNSNKAMKTHLLIMPSDIFDIETWRMFFYFGKFPFKAVVLKPDYNFIPELVKAIKETQFVFFGRKDLNMGFSGYLDYQVEMVKACYLSHYEKERFIKFEHFLQSYYMQYKEECLREMDDFEISESFEDENGTRFYLLERVSVR